MGELQRQPCSWCINNNEWHNLRNGGETNSQEVFLLCREPEHPAGVLRGRGEVCDGDLRGSHPGIDAEGRWDWVNRSELRSVFPFRFPGDASVWEYAPDVQVARWDWALHGHLWREEDGQRLLLLIQHHQAKRSVVRTNFFFNTACSNVLFCKKGRFLAKDPWA